MRCLICHRSLSNLESVAQGVGPECGEQYINFVNSCGLRTDQVTAMTLGGNSTCQRWLRLTNCALRASNQRDAAMFLRAAQREYERADYLLEEMTEAA